MQFVRIGIALAIFFSGSFAAQGAVLVGPCSDCHTMHNSEQGEQVAVRGIGGQRENEGPIRNLLRMDCVACHAQGKDSRIASLPGGSQVPQVYHSDTSDLAAGNFRYIGAGVNSENRKGHNVIDLFPGGDDTGSSYTKPPGFRFAADCYWDEELEDDVCLDEHVEVFATTAEPFGKFTCAGAGGCHGTRHQLAGARPRVGIEALSGAHHQSHDGMKNPAQNVAAVHDGDRVAAGYRFIPGLKGTGNTAARWQNVDSASHNEYYALPLVVDRWDSYNWYQENTLGRCENCHLGNEKSTESTLLVPYQSMSGFCLTCHGDYHSAGAYWVNSPTAVIMGPNGTSGAFRRHPSDYVIPDRDEYAAYLTYNITAPVARPTLYEAASPVVTPGADLVMCLSCHLAHAGPYDSMLRFDYAALTTQMRAGDSTAVRENAEGCLACHTVKGILPYNR